MGVNAYAAHCTADDRNVAYPIHTHDIVDVRGDIRGTHISYRCRSCQHVFESYRETLAGVSCGSYPCPSCGERAELSPRVFVEFASQCFPYSDLGNLVDLTNEASRIAREWYRHPKIAAVLRHRGVDLGEPTERELLSFVSDGLLRERRRAKPGS